MKLQKQVGGTYLRPRFEYFFALASEDFLVQKMA